MKSLIAAELLKVRTTRALWVAAMVVLAYAVLGPVLVAVAPEGASSPTLGPALLAEALRSPARLAGAALLLIGLLAAAGEFGHGTVITTRLAEPRSTRVLVAKVAALSIVGLAFGAVLALVSMGATAALLAAKGVAVEPLGHGVPRFVGILVMLTALHAALGVAIGSLLRNTAAAVGTVLMWAFVVEGVVPVLARKPEMVDWLPSGAVSQVLAEQPAPGQLAAPGAAALLLGYALVVVGASMAADRVREL